MVLLLRSQLLCCLSFRLVGKSVNPLKSGGLFHPYILEESICYLRGIRCNFLGLFGSRQKLLLANSGDPDQMQHNVASDLGLHCFAYVPLLRFHDNNGLIVWPQTWYSQGICMRHTKIS